MKNKYCGKASCPWEMAHRHLDDGSVMVRATIVVPEDILWPRPTTQEKPRVTGFNAYDSTGHDRENCDCQVCEHMRGIS